MGGRGNAGARNSNSLFESVHNQGLQKLIDSGNEIIQSDVYRTIDQNQSTNSHIVAALVKSKKGNYSIRTAPFSSVNDEYRQRNNFHVGKMLRGYSESEAKLEYEDFVNRVKENIEKMRRK